MLLIFVTANYIVSGLDEPGQSEAVNTIEDPNSTAMKEAGVSRTET
jgi:receptor expression-enhancing protein 5/6